MDQHVFARGQFRIGGQRLRYDANRVANAVGVGHNVMPADHCRTRSRRRQCGHHADQRRFSGAIGSEQAEDFACGNCEAHFLHGHEVSELLLQLLDFDRIRFHRAHRARCFSHVFIRS